MTVGKGRIGLLIVAALVAVAAPALAQWSIGAKGDRPAPAGESRYAFLVFANPRPGEEQAFNEWYDYQHQGDLIQLDGWTGVQRFRLVSTIEPRLGDDAYRFGYLALWDQQTDDPAKARRALDAAQDGGKARKSDTFDYRHGASPKALYEVVGARILRPDGVRTGIPAATDVKNRRLDRYLVLEFSDPPASISVADYNRELDTRIAEVLQVPGWMTAQHLKAVPTPGARGTADETSPYPKTLIIWEVQASSAQAAQDALTMATKDGLVLPATPAAPGASLTYWQPIGPYIDRDSFER